jgi:hypothetical protein
MGMNGLTLQYCRKALDLPKTGGAKTPVSGCEAWVILLRGGHEIDQDHVRRSFPSHVATCSSAGLWNDQRRGAAVLREHWMNHLVLGRLLRVLAP